MPLRREANGTVAVLREGKILETRVRTERRMAQLVDWLERHDFPAPVREFRFHPVRGFRFDLAWPRHLVALEVDGGVWRAGRHVRPAGFLRDREKDNEACRHGWRVLHATWDSVMTSAFAWTLHDALHCSRWAAVHQQEIEESMPAVIDLRGPKRK